MTTIPITKARQQISLLLKKAQHTPIHITRRGQTVGVLLTPDEYARLRRLEAWADVVQISSTLQGNVNASALHRASRRELMPKANKKLNR